MVTWYYKKRDRGVPYMLAPRRGCLDYSKFYCDVRKRLFPVWNQKRYITYCIFHIQYTNSEISFDLLYIPHHFVGWHRLNHCAALVRNLQTSILIRASGKFLDIPYDTSIIFALLLWFTNFESCRFQNLSISTLPCLAETSCMAWSKLSNNIEGS